MLARGALGELAQLTEQPALADPGLAGDEQDAAGPRQHLVEGLTRRCQLSVPSDQRGVHAGEAAMPAHGAGGREGLARRDRFGLPLRIDVDRCAPAERVLDRAMGGLGDEDRVRWSRRLESRRGVDGVAERGVLDPLSRPDVAEHDGSGGHAHANAEPLDAP